MNDLDFEIKRTDTLPALQVQIINTATGLAEDLTNASNVAFKMRNVESKAMIVDDDGTNGAVVGDPLDGSISYTWQSADTDVAALYEGDFKITFVGGGQMTVPNTGHILIRVRDDVDDDA